MTVIRPNSVSGITSITAQANEINFFRSNGTLAGLQLNGVNFNTTTGVSTFAALKVTGNLDVEGVLTYQDVTNVDSVGIITARSNIDAQGDVSIADKIVHTGDTNTAIRFPANDTITFETAGAEKARITGAGTTAGGLFLVGTNDTGYSGFYTTMTVGDASGANSGITIAASPTGYSRIHFADANSGAARYAGFIAYSHADDALLFSTNNSGSDKLRITSTGQLLVGTGSASNRFKNGNGNGATPKFQFETANVDEQNDISLTFGRNNAFGAEIILAKHRAATVGGYTVVQSDDRLGGINFAGSDGTHFRPAALIQGRVDGTPGTADMPGRLEFLTTADGAATPTERMRIDSSGRVIIGGTSPTTELLDVKGNIRMRQVNGNSGVNSDNVVLYMGMSDNNDQGKTAIVAKPIGSWGRHDLLFCLDNVADLNNVGLGDVKMTLTNDGYVTTPQQPSFMANFGGNNNVSHNNGDYLKANSTDHNTGNCYNTSNYRFTAPVAGNYLFYGRANMSGVGSGDYARSYQVRLYKNNSSEQFHMSRTTLTGYAGSYPDSSTMVCSINLAANDYVQLRVNWETDGTLSGTENLHHHGSMFGGYLIG